MLSVYGQLPARVTDAAWPTSCVSLIHAADGLFGLALIRAEDPGYFAPANSPHYLARRYRQSRTKVNEMSRGRPT